MNVRERFFEYVSVILLSLSTVLLVGLQFKPHAWILLLISALTLLLCSKAYAKNVFLLHASVAILGLTSISTDITYENMFEMAVTLTLAIAVPYIISTYVFKEKFITFKFHHGRRWFKREIAYIFFTIIVSYFLLPFYLVNSQAYLNWTVDSGVWNITRLFIGTNALGIWDELFFVSTVLGVLRMFFPFWQANMFQAVLFTSFLFELGFTGWGPFMIYPFALLQGYVFKKTESLFYVITIHLSLDFVLFLALIWSHHPSWMPIFI